MPGSVRSVTARPTVPAPTGPAPGPLAAVGLASWLLLGFVAGLVGGVVTGARQARGCVHRIVVGILGALIGGALARAAGYGGISGFDVRSVAIAGAGSVLLLLVLEALERR